jgi:hypothetical protein
MNVRENLGSYIVIGILIVLAVLIVTEVISCSTNRPEPVQTNNTVKIDKYVYRTIDEELGIVCYHQYNYVEGLSCLELPQ